MFLFPRKRRKINILSVAVIILGIAGAAGTVFRVVGNPDAAQSLIGAASGIIVAVLIVVSALWDTVKDFVRYYDFRAKRRGDKIYIRYGFFKKVEYTVPVNKIQALKLRQSFVWAAWAFPAVIYTIIVAVCAAVCASAMPEYSVWAVAGTAVLEVCLVVGMILKYLTEGSLAEKDFLKLAKGYFARSYLVVRYRNIQYVRFSRNPLAKAFGIQKGEIHLLASSADTSHSIPYFKGNGEEIIKEGMLR